MVAAPNATTVEVAFPSGHRERAPNERVGLIQEPQRLTGSLAGPLSTEYPQAILPVPATAPASKLAALDNYTIHLSHTPDLTSIPADQRPDRVDPSLRLLQYGDYIAHLLPDRDRHNPWGWSVSQYLGYNEYHDTKEHPRSLCVRRLNRLPGTTHRGPFWYDWRDTNGDMILATKRTKARGHDDPPKGVKNTTDLGTLWDYIPFDDVLEIVNLTSRNRISNASWNKLLAVVQARKIEHIFAY